MDVQVKLTKEKRGVVVYDSCGDGHVCTDSQDFWDVIRDLNGSLAVPGATRIRVKSARNQIHVMTEDGEISICENQSELWTCVCEALGSELGRHQLALVPVETPHAVANTPQSRLPTRERRTVVIDVDAQEASKPMRRGDGWIGGIVTLLAGSEDVGDAFMGTLEKYRSRPKERKGPRARRKGRRKRG